MREEWEVEWVKHQFRKIQMMAEYNNPAKMKRSGWERVQFILQWRGGGVLGHLEVSGGGGGHWATSPLPLLRAEQRTLLFERPWFLSFDPLPFFYIAIMTEFFQSIGMLSQTTYRFIIYVRKAVPCGPMWSRCSMGGPCNLRTMEEPVFLMAASERFISRQIVFIWLWGSSSINYHKY